MQTTNSSISHNAQINQLLHEIAQEDNKPADEIMIESLRERLDTLKRKKLQQQIKNASNLVSKPNTESDEWGDFFEKTAGSFADNPIERAPQGELEQRLELL
jgi:regulator of RNase E activity RraB